MAARCTGGLYAGGHGRERTGDEQAVPTRLALALVGALEQAALAARHLLSDLEEGAGRAGGAQGCAAARPAPSTAAALLPGRVPDPHALSDLWWAAGRVAELDRALAEARAAFARLTATIAHQHADRLAAALAPASHADGLTERETAVLRLVAAGRSNREAAAALAVSERTVERHLENTYRKIDARNRADAVAYAVRHNLTER